MVMDKIISNYVVTEMLYESSNSLVCRAVTKQNNISVILKLLQPDTPTQAELDRFQYEYEITDSINNKGINTVLSIEPYHSTLIIIEEDIAAESLDNYMERSRLTLNESLSIAIQTAQNIEHIHAENIIHKNINPSNIIWNKNTNQVKIIDFGIASRLASENVTLKAAVRLEGNLSYLSPEQTGRINRSVDYRTDLYSLGVTLYEIFTGELPFMTNDPIELVHCHLAKKPAPVCDINKDIPKIISDIIMKLLEKNAEDRYQSAHGIKEDLGKCQEELAKSKNISSFQFELGLDDFSSHFKIPQKLYGRENEKVTILEAFERASSGKAEVIIIAGYSGIGKTVLVHEVHKPMTEKQGCFISGKFEQYKQNIPYYGITQAFGEFCQSLLKENSETLQWWKSKILKALGKNGQVIIDVIPNLELIIGVQPAVAEVGSAEAQNRFNLYFLNFFKALCDKDYPLIIFLDDLQWADLPTLNLVNLMMTDPDARYLLFIGAYRENEISDVHPLPRILDNINNQTSFTNITLKPLGFFHVNNLISDSTISSLEKAESLTKIVYEKTGGNPFFVNMFLKTIAKKKLIEFDFYKREWIWDVELICSMGITNSVVDMMVDRISQLPTETQNILSLAACLGSKFNLKILSLIYGHSGSAVFDELWEAVADGLIIPIEDDYKWIRQGADNDNEAMFRFLHDRVQQAAYSLIPPKERCEKHFKIGCLLQNSLTEEEFVENLFEITNHFNQGKELISDAGERVKIAHLNLKTARKAKLSSAYLPALNYIEMCIEFLPENSWKINYELTLACYFEKGEIEYLNAQWDEAIVTFDEVSEHADTLLEQCKVSAYKATLYRMKNDLNAALDIGISALSTLGIKLKAFPDADDVAIEIESCNQMLNGKDTDSLFHLPELTDPLKLQAMELLRECFAPAYFLGSNLIAIIGVRMTKITVEDGNNPHSSVGYIFLSSITLAISQKEYDDAYKYGLLALRLNDDKYQIKAYEALIYDMWGTFICPYKKSVSISRKHLMKGYYSGVENGSYQWAGYCAIIYLFQSFWGTDTLDEVETMIDGIVHGLSSIDPNMVQYYYAVRATIHNLKEPAQDWGVFDDEFWPNSTEILKQSEIHNDLLTPFVDAVCRLSLANIFSSEKANDYAHQAEQYLAGAPGIFLNPIFYFHQTVAYSSTFQLVDETEKDQYRKTIKENLERFKIWAHNCPENYLHFYELMKAEYGRIMNAPVEDIMLHYDKAIEASEENSFIQNQALAYELASRFYHNIGRKIIFHSYLTEAHRCYKQWGARVKVQNLESQYPKLLNRKISNNKEEPVVSSQPDVNSPSNQQTTSIQLDLGSVVKASQVLSREIVLSSLLKKMMHILIENAGATRGLLILEKDDQWLIEAEGILDYDEVTVHQSIAVKESEQVPATLINYISRTRENVVLSDATGEGGFTTDAYIIKERPKSVMGLPLLNHGKLNGILYLENNLITSAFTADRLQVINLLAFQAGISLENARLFEQKQTYAEELVEEIAERKQTEESLHKYEQIVSSSTDMLAFLDKDYTYLASNNEYMKAFNLTTEMIIGRTVEDVFGKKFFTSVIKPHADICLAGKEVNFQDWFDFPSAGKQYMDITYYPYYADDNEILGFVVNGRNITESKLAEENNKKLEQKLQQAQKMEAIGTLAGGIAHDFNNILGVIIGYTDMIKQDSALESEVNDDLEQVIIAANRAKDLVKQILAFSRQTQVERIPIKIQSLIKEGLKMLRSSIPSTIEFIENIDSDCGSILADPTQINQILINLCTNSYHAMEKRGGTLTIILKKASINTVDQERLLLPATGEYIELIISDTGTGISPENLEKVFDPYFTTKKVGKGTGMGLAIIHGIVSSYKGAISLDSKIGKGSTFHIYFPLVENNALPEIKESEETPKGNERILFIDDEELLTKLHGKLLRSLGYHVTVLSDSFEALEIFKNTPNEFDLVITDQTMPNITGSELAAELIKTRADIPIILCSGYSDLIDDASARKIGIKEFALKPITSSVFAKLIRKALNDR